MKTSNRFEFLKSSIPDNMLLQIQNKRIMDKMSLNELLNILSMQKLLIDVPKANLTSWVDAQKLVIANRFRIKRQIDKKQDNTFAHFYTPVSEFRDSSVNLHKIWKYLPYTPEKRVIAMKLCCINYEKVFTKHERDLIEGMETVCNQAGIIKKTPAEINILRIDLQ